MFAKFNLKLDVDLNNYYEIGQEVFNKNRAEIKEELDSFISIDGSLKGTRMQEYWFPQINADVFISHSHDDEKKAIALAGWLYDKFKLRVFIDSCVWGYAGDLLKLIDKKYCFNEDTQTYDYTRRNYSTSHVYMMLSTALSMMIDRSESIFFLNTPNSITSAEIVSNTKSPWIYSEIAMTQLVRNKRLSEYRKEQIEKFAKSINESKQLTVKYNIDLSHFVQINDNDLANWLKTYNKREYPLDKLYESKGIITQVIND